MDAIADDILLDEGTAGWLLVRTLNFTAGIAGKFAQLFDARPSIRHLIIGEQE